MATRGKMIDMKMSDGKTIGVYRVEPKGARRAGLVLIQEIFGVTDHIKETSDSYADEGYEVLAPALYDREAPGFQATYSPDDIQRAIQIRKLAAIFPPSTVICSMRRSFCGAARWRDRQTRRPRLPPSLRGREIAAHIIAFATRRAPWTSRGDHVVGQQPERMRSALTALARMPSLAVIERILLHQEQRRRLRQAIRPEILARIDRLLRHVEQQAAARALRRHDAHGVCATR
jgi:hypothetical protein